MSRADVAGTPARAGARPNFAWRHPFRHVARSATQPAGLRTRFEQGWASRWALPLALCGVAVLSGGLLLATSLRERDRLLTSATAELQLVAAMVGDDVERNGRGQPAETAQAILDHLALARPADRGLRVLVTDASGGVIATWPQRVGRSERALLQLGAAPTGVAHALAHPVAVETTPLHLDGGDALATSRSLRVPFGRLVMSRPVDDLLSDWWSSQVDTMLAAAFGALLIVALAFAYQRQVARTLRATRACRSLRERVDMVLARGRCGLWDWNVATGRLEWSKSMFEMVGLRAHGQVLDAAEVDALIHPDDGGLEAMLRAVAPGRVPSEHVFRMRSASGSWVWLRTKAEMVDVQGASHLVGIAVDITAAMALEERTARADMRLRDAIETISEAFVVWDADNRLVMCNSKFQRFHDLPADATVAGTPYSRVMESGTAPLIHSQIALGAQQPEGARTFEAQLGDGRWLQINERRTKDGGYVSVGTDITTLKRHEEQLLESERRLMNTVLDLRRSRQTLEQQAQQLSDLADRYLEQKAEAESANRAKSDFLANMGHELRTPLNAILGFSEIMALESFGKLGSPQYLEYSTHIHQSGQHLLGLIADILEMARLEAGRVRLDKVALPVGEAVAGAVASVSAAALRNNVAITVEGPQASEVHADRNALEKILTIFLNNAVKYTPAEGRIVIRSAPGEATFDLTVEDTGAGMPPDAVARLGRPFEQANPTMRNGIRGSGLGLAIAHSLVELHGGTMRVSSIEGVGTTVLIQLPQRCAPVRQVQAVATRPMPRALPVMRLSRSA